MYLYICLNLFIFQRYIFQISSWTRNKNIPRSNYPFIFITYHQFSQTIIHPSIHTSHKQPIADNKLTLGILPDIGIHLAARGSTTLTLSLNLIARKIRTIIRGPWLQLLPHGCNTCATASRKRRLVSPLSFERRRMVKTRKKKKKEKEKSGGK